MEIERALSQISEIHEHLARGEVCRDWRAGPIALTGLLALGAAAVQSRLLGGPAAPAAFVAYWCVVAALAALIGGGGIAGQYRRETRPFARRRTRTVLGQFLPCVAAGAIVTAGADWTSAAAVAALPGLWAVLFGLGMFASRPYLPRLIGWVALFYLVAGGVMLMMAGSGASLNPWAMGATFGAGQLASGGILYWNLERNHHGQT